MKRLLAAALLLLAPLAAQAHAGHGLAPGHEWFHALLPFVGAALILAARSLLARVGKRSRAGRLP